MSHITRDPFPSAVDFLSVPAPRRTWRQRFLAGVRLWLEREAARQMLARVDVRTLRDLGIAPAQADFEADRPFWHHLGQLR